MTTHLMEVQFNQYSNEKDIKNEALKELNAKSDHHHFLLFQLT